jgi:hypothetical protein
MTSKTSKTIKYTCNSCGKDLGEADADVGPLHAEMIDASSDSWQCLACAADDDAARGDLDDE